MAKHNSIKFGSIRLSKLSNKCENEPSFDKNEHKSERIISIGHSVTELLKLTYGYWLLAHPVYKIIFKLYIYNSILFENFHTLEARGENRAKLCHHVGLKLIKDGLL